MGCRIHYGNVSTEESGAGPTLVHFGRPTGMLALHLVSVIIDRVRLVLKSLRNKVSPTTPVRETQVPFPCMRVLGVSDRGLNRD